MKRRKIPENIQADVLLACRRRCAICFGLQRDTKIKQGQIAHLDQSAENNAPDNLVFLCLEHHDLFDTRTSQSKRLTPLEVREFRRELHEAIGSAWREPIGIGEVTYQETRWPEGHYVREGAHEEAELDVRYVSSSRLRVTGLAFWGTNRPFGPNMGELNFEADLDGDLLRFEDQLPWKPQETYRATLRFRESGLTVEEDYVIAYFGMNVSFAGEYARV